MNMKKAVAAAFGAALLTASTGATSHALFDKNKSGSATNAGKATGGKAKATLKGTTKVSTKASAKSALVSSGNKGVEQTSSTKNKGGKAAAKVQGGAKTGDVDITNIP